MISCWFALGGGWLLAAHFSTVKTIFGLVRRDGFQPGSRLQRREAAVRLHWEDGRFLHTVALGRIIGTVLFTLGAWCFLPALHHSDDRVWMPVVQGAAIVFLLFVVGHVIPRLLARRFAERLLPWSLVIQDMAGSPLRPLVTPFTALQEALEKRWGWDMRLGYLSEAERQRLEQARNDKSDVEDDVERDLLRAVLEFGETTVREIMTSRVQVVALPVDARRDQVLDTARASRYSRIPVFRDSLDRVVGILHISDLLFRDVTSESAFQLRSFLRPARFVPETMRIADLMREFRERRTHMVVVVDEHGGVSGIATLEDVLEEIVGDIRDENDLDERPPVRPQHDGSWEVDGETRIDDLVEDLPRELPRLEIPEHAEVDTLAGLVLHLAGAIPEEGRIFESSGWSIEVRRMEGHRIALLALRPQSRTDTAATDDDQQADDDAAETRLVI